MCEDLTARPWPLQTALNVSGGYLCTALNVACENVFECAIIQLCDIRNQSQPRHRQFLMSTSVTLWSCKSWLAQAAVGAPVAVTVPPQATGRAWLPVGAVAINKSAAWYSVRGLGRRTKVIQLSKRKQKHLVQPLTVSHTSKIKKAEAVVKYFNPAILFCVSMFVMLWYYTEAALLPGLF